MPLSSQQQSWWTLVHERMVGYTDPGGGYRPLNVWTAWRLSEPAFDHRSIERCFADVVRRHESLRLEIVEHDGQPLQRVCAASAVDASSVDVTFRDVSMVPEPQREEAVRAAVADAVLRSFDYSGAPLLRGVVVRMGGDEYCVVAIAPHLAADAWSIQIIAGEIQTLVERRGAAEGEALPPVPWQHSDFIEWQRGWLSGPERAGMRRRMHDRFAGASAIVFPIEGSAGAQHHAGVRILDVPADIGAAVNQVCRDQQVTPLTLWSAVLARALAQSSGHDDVLIRVILSGRRQPRMLRMVGYLAGAAPVRINASGAPPMRELLDRARRAVLEALDDDGVPSSLYGELASEAGFVLPLNGVVLDLVPMTPNVFRPRRLGADADEFALPLFLGGGGLTPLTRGNLWVCAGLDPRPYLRSMQRRQAPSAPLPPPLVAAPEPAPVAVIAYAQRVFTPTSIQRLCDAAMSAFAELAAAPITAEA